MDATLEGTRFILAHAVSASLSNVRQPVRDVEQARGRHRGPSDFEKVGVRFSRRSLQMLHQ